MDEKPRVLVVDDESSARDTLEAFLFREGYDLAFAASGPEALDRLDELEPDVILLDVIMPGMDGIEACQRLKTDKRWRHIPIILVTVLDSKEDLARGLYAGADDFLSKPVNALELRARVRSMLRIKKQYDKLIGTITERKRAEAEIQRHLQEMTLLSQVTTVIASAVDMADALHNVCAELALFLQVPQAGFAILNPQRTAAEVIADYHPPSSPSAMGVILPVADNPSMAYILEHKAPLAVTDAQTDPLLAPVHEIMRQRNVQSILIVPVIVGGEVIGTLGFDAFQRWVFSASDIDLVQHVASQVGQVLIRKRAEEALRESEERFRAIFETAQDSIFIKDHTLKYAQVNPAMERLFGLPASKRIGRTDEDLFGEEAEAHIREVDSRVLGGEIIEEEHTKSVKGIPRTFHVIKVPMRDGSGEITGLCGIARDITERKRAEDQLRRYAAELEQSNEELKAFAYTVSHDLRAPLVNLKGFVAELGAALAVIGSAVITALPHLDEEQRPAVTTTLREDLPEALGFIDSSVTRMDDLINALLKLSRLGRRELKLEPIDMGALVRATLETLAHQIEERQVKVTVGALPEVVADRTAMEQIVGNLLSNAVLYLDPGRPGEIEVIAERGPSTGSGRGSDEMTFRVRDNGRGIAEEDMDKVFAPFRRAGGQDVPGEGMGLPYVQTLVRRHGGRIWCESEPGVGTTFTFTLSNHLAGDL